MAETFRQQPDSQNFTQLVREKTNTHPKLEQRRVYAHSLNERVTALHIPPSTNARLIPKFPDQGLVVTAYDEFEGWNPEVAPVDSQEAWKILWEYNLRLANHPVRIAAMQALEAKGFVAPPKLDGVLNRALADRRPLQLSDLAQNTDFAGMLRPRTPLDDGKEREIFVANIGNKEQVHRTEMLAVTPFSFFGRRVRNFFGTGAMPDIMGSVLALETATKMGMIAEIPEVGQFSDPAVQAALAKNAIERLKEDDPNIFMGHTPENIAYMKSLWLSSLVGVVEVDETKALRRAEKLAEVGINTFRVYGHTQGGDVVKSVQAIRKRFPDSEIFASQITDVDIALACEYAGADAIIVGVGSGGRCSTADRAQLIPSNAQLPWALRGLLQIPVIGEGGAIDEPVVAALVGMSGVNGSGSIGGGTFEAPGGALFFRNKHGQLIKPYGGEASDRFKELSERTYGGTGLPYFSEGHQTSKPLLPFEESMTQKVIKKWEDMILGMVVMGVNEGWDSIGVLHRLDPSPLYEKSGTTQQLQRPH